MEAPHLLSAEEIEFLASASLIVCALDSGSSEIVAERRPGGRGKRKLVIPCTSDVRCYGRPLRSPRRGWESWPRAEFDPLIKTFVKLLRPGDEIKLIWLAENANEYMLKAGLTCDELRAEIIRDGQWEASFRLAQRITPPDSTARMIDYERATALPG